MKIEREILQFKTDYQLQNMALTDLQLQYVPVLAAQSSIESTVHFFLKQGWLVSFQELFGLVEKLVQHEIILNPSFGHYFKQVKPQAFVQQSSPTPTKVRPAVTRGALRELPFFRSLDVKLADLLLSQAKIVQMPTHSSICRVGETGRDMFVMLSGQAGVYRPTAQNQHQMVATLTEGSLFGEAGFFLGSPRSANIITQQPSEILVIPYQAEILERHIDKNKAQGLQLRFWVQHALQSSDLFKNIPSDCLDALGFAGKVVKILKDNILFQEGHVGHSAYIIIQGSLVVSQKNQAIAVMKQGSFFGEISLLLSQGLRTASVHSQQETLLLEIQRDEFYKLLAQNLFLGKELEKLAQERLLKDQQRSAS